MSSSVLLLIATLLGVVLGAVLCLLLLRSRIRAAFDDGKAENAVALATAAERLRSLESDRSQSLQVHEALKSQASQWQSELEQVREERTRLQERASRLPPLEAQLAGLLTQQAAAQDDILRLSRSEAEKSQSLQSASHRVAELEQGILDTEQVLADTSRQAADLREAWGRIDAELKAEREALSAVRSDLSAARIDAEQARAQANKLGNELTELTTTLQAERNQAQEKLGLLLDAKEALSNQFKSLANDILEEKSKRFAEQNQTSMGQLLEPLKVKLQEFQGKVEEVYVQEGKDRSALAEQVRQLMDLNQTLSQDAKNLTRALKGSNKAQGNWGELVLERVLEASGLRKGEEYDVQESHTREDGSRAQPDVVIHLPEDRHLVVDAKVSLNAYEDYATAEEEGDRQAAVKRHLDSVRGHIKGLSGKNYQVLYGLKSLDFVLMFIPIEPAFMLAVTHDRELFMDAWEKNVLLVSPSTLLFVVRTVAHLWRQEAQNRNAQDIAKRGAELYDKLVGFVEDIESLGYRLKQAQKDYDSAYNKLTSGKGNVIRQAEMLRQLGVKPTKSLPAPLVEFAMDDESLNGGPQAPGA